MWVVKHPDGKLSQHHDEPDEGIYAEVPRELDLLIESWDFVNHQIVEIEEGRKQRCDQSHLADYGPDSIKQAHIRKALEAQIILAGIPLPHSLVAAEAAELGLDVNDLASQVVAKAQADYDLELARRAAKANIG